MSQSNTVSLRDQIRMQEIDERHDLSQQIFFRRKDQELSQEDLAEQAQLTQPQVAKLEAGHANPTLRTLVKVAHGLGCRIRNLFEPDPSGLAADWGVSQTVFVSGTSMLGSGTLPSEDHFTIADSGEVKFDRTTTVDSKLGLRGAEAGLGTDVTLRVVEGDLEGGGKEDMSSSDDAQANEMLALGA